MQQRGGSLFPVRPGGVAGGGGGGNLPPIVNIRDLFDLDYLRVSSGSVHPFEAVDIEWSIKPKGTATFQNFSFRLTGDDKVLLAGLAASGTTRISAHTSILLRIQGRPAGGGVWIMLGAPLELEVDESECEQISLYGSYVDYFVAQGMADFDGANASIRLRTDLVDLKPVRRQVEASWETGVVKYYFPLEVVLNNFFNADLDVRAELRLDVEHDGDDTDLRVSIDHSSNVDFDTIEDVVSFGHSVTVAKTANRLIPIILTLAAREIERAIAQALLSYVASTATIEPWRLLSVRVAPEPEHISFVVCPWPRDTE